MTAQPRLFGRAGAIFCVKPTSSPTVALFRDFAVLVVAPQGKTTVSFRSPVPPHSAGLFLLRAGSQGVRGWRKRFRGPEGRHIGLLAA